MPNHGGLDDEEVEAAAAAALAWTWSSCASALAMASSLEVLLLMMLLLYSRLASVMDHGLEQKNDTEAISIEAAR